MSIDIIKIMKAFAMLGAVILAIGISTFLTVSYFAYKAKVAAIQEAGSTVVHVVDAERIQNYLKDHCAKHPDHLRCAAIK